MEGSASESHTRRAIGVVRNYVADTTDARRKCLVSRFERAHPPTWSIRENPDLMSKTDQREEKHEKISSPFSDCARPRGDNLRVRGRRARTDQDQDMSND